MMSRETMMMRTTERMRPAPLLLGFLMLVGCGQEAAPPRQPPAVTVASPEVRTIQEYGVFTGTSRAVEMAEVVARVAGRLETVDFEPGRRVEKNEVLFTIEPDAYIASRDAAAASVKSAEAELLRAETELRRVTRASENNAVSDMDVDTAQASRDKAEAGLLSAQAVLADAELNLGYTRVRSPIEGVVGRNLVDAGNLVGQSGPTLLTTVNKLQPIYVYFHAPEPLVLRYLAAVRELETREDVEDTPEHVGQAFIELANETGFPHEGVVDFVNNTVDPNTGTIEMRVRLENKRLSLFPGLFVRIKVIGTEIPDQVLVPESAVGSDLGGKYLYIVGEDNIVEQRYVDPGLLQDDGTVQIPEGVSADDTVIVNGLMFARPGLPVTPLTAEQFEQMQKKMAEQGAR
jgi:RND family efflux transporter MFP subunit